MDKEWVDAGAAAVAALTFAAGIVQYARAQAWRRSEFAWQMVDRLSKDPQLALCRVFMDWSPRRIKIPDEYADIMEPSEARTIFRHSWAALALALDKGSNFTLEEVMYRDYFDAFFSYLQ